jgi:hypothetical protein
MVPSPDACSGAMYAGVPITMPVCVSGLCAGPACVRDSEIARAMPKSVTCA